MSSKRNILHEFHFPADVSRNRQNIDIDGFRLIEASKDEPRQKEEEQKTDDSSLSTIFARVWLGIVPFSQLQTLNIIAGDKGLKETSGFPTESMAASRIGEGIARRSLARDAAFFTSAGVLNPEELSLVNNGYRKSETVTHILPGVEQEFWKSTESSSTLDSDYSLSSLEIDLFDDMRACMQKSSKSSTLVNSSCKHQSQTDNPNPHFSKRLDTTSTRAKPFSVSRSPKTNADGVGKKAKEAINPSKEQHGTPAREHEPSSSLKLSKAFDQSNPFSSGTAKRASISANQMEVNNKIRKLYLDKTGQRNLVLVTVVHHLQNHLLDVPTVSIKIFHDLFVAKENSRELALNGVKFHSGMLNSSKTRNGANHLYGTPNGERSSKLQSQRTSPRAANLKEKKLGSPWNGTQFSRDIKLNCAAKLEGEKAGTIKSSTATTFMAKTDPSGESSNEFGLITDSDKGRIQPKWKEHVSQIGEKTSQDQNEKIIANRDEKENSFRFKSQMDVLTKQIEANDVKEYLVIEL
ncbi:Detected protein of unknown function [Hibiscus syriacus]|uniref:Uncharacterized protein n=1 Tax=Hibiscus syriacus TaxID=106335 RepID=A0A6A2Z013_HIBSY|nr:Detected protein of unknown function [Hibiscus syriacus]